MDGICHFYSVSRLFTKLHSDLDSAGRCLSVEQFCQFFRKQTKSHTDSTQLLHLNCQTFQNSTEIPMYKNLVDFPFQLKFAFVFFYSWTLQNVFTSENAGECFFQSRVILATQFKALGVIWSCNTPFRSTQLNSKPTKEKKTHHQWTPIPEIPNNAIQYHAISYNTM